MDDKADIDSKRFTWVRHGISLIGHIGGFTVCTSTMSADRDQSYLDFSIDNKFRQMFQRFPFRGNRHVA